MLEHSEAIEDGSVNWMIGENIVQVQIHSNRQFMLRIGRKNNNALLWVEMWELLLDVGVEMTSGNFWQRNSEFHALGKCVLGHSEAIEDGSVNWMIGESIVEHQIV